MCIVDIQNNLDEEEFSERWYAEDCLIHDLENDRN